MNLAQPIYAEKLQPKAARRMNHFTTRLDHHDWMEVNHPQSRSGFEV